jgi:predicted SnoaL-like aldol condensation-catalyzing enzyme
MTQREVTLKAKTMDFYNNILATGHHDSLGELFSDTYAPYCALLKDVPVLEPGLKALHQRLARRGTVPHQVHRIIADGDYVFVQVKYDGAMPVAGADIFRFDGSGRIAEHWNSRQPIPQDTASGVDRFAGGGDASLPLTQERRGEIKKILTDVLLDMWGNGNAELVPIYYEKSYIQHNPDMPGGYDRIKEIVETEIKKYIKLTGGRFPVDIHLMGAEGDLIFVYYSIFMAGINRNAGARSTNTDVFRIGPNNRMIEHWDVLQMEGEPLPDDHTVF